MKYKIIHLCVALFTIQTNIKTAHHHNTTIETEQCLDNIINQALQDFNTQEHILSSTLTEYTETASSIPANQVTHEITAFLILGNNVPVERKPRVRQKPSRLCQQGRNPHR